MHEALRSDVVVSKRSLLHDKILLPGKALIGHRDVYYRDPALFGSQQIVDRYVDDIALTFGITRSSLNVTAAAKGLIAGAAMFYKRDGSVITLSRFDKGVLVFDPKELLSVDVSTVQWILVIEKEATFRSLCASSFWQTFSSQGILITGKGYPDLSTRSLLRFMGIPSIKNGFRSVPAYGLADFDPDGLSILSVYKHGSMSLAHESATHQVPDLRWLGLRSAHLGAVISNVYTSQEVLPLTKRDRIKAMRMLEREPTHEIFCNESDGEAISSRTELQKMLMLNFKAELQALDAIPRGVEDLLAPLRAMATDNVSADAVRP
jgi:meiotic recombination protein SPO11